MNKIMDILIGLGISMFMLVIWVYEMLVTSDIHVEMLFRDSVLISCLLILFCFWGLFIGCFLQYVNTTFCKEISSTLFSNFKILLLNV
jgi:hypothetical protein